MLHNENVDSIHIYFVCLFRDQKNNNCKNRQIWDFLDITGDNNNMICCFLTTHTVSKSCSTAGRENAFRRKGALFLQTVNAECSSFLQRILTNLVRCYNIKFFQCNN